MERSASVSSVGRNSVCRSRLARHRQTVVQAQGPSDAPPCWPDTIPIPLGPLRITNRPLPTQIPQPCDLGAVINAARLECGLTWSGLSRRRLPRGRLGTLARAGWCRLGSAGLSEKAIEEIDDTLGVAARHSVVQQMLPELAAKGSGEFSHCSQRGSLLIAAFAAGALRSMVTHSVPGPTERCLLPA
jgi:hypothetical protein